YMLRFFQSGLQPISDANGLIIRIASIGNVVVYLLISLAVIYIVWNVVQYFIKGKAGDESRKEAGTNVMWGILGLAIIISIWGLVNIVLGTFNTGYNRPGRPLPNADFVNPRY